LAEGAPVFEVEEYNREYKNENSSDDEDEGETSAGLPDDAVIADLLKAQPKSRSVEVGWKGAEDYDNYLSSEDIAVKQSAYFNELLAEHFG